MKLPKDQPFWTSVILHAVVLIGLFLATVVEAIRPKEKPHVFEMVAPPSRQQTAVPAPSSPAQTVPEIPVPDLPAVPELIEPVRQAPPPRPTRPELMSYEDFLKENPIREPRPRQPQSPRKITVPQIDTPEVIIPSSSSPAAPSAQQLTPQQMSALGNYSAQLRARIDQAWSKPPDLGGIRIAATVVFDVSASGRVTNVRLNPRSGNSAFDQSILAAFRRVLSAGPTPTGQGHSFTMTFRMVD